MCVGSIVTIECESCGSTTEKSSYLGCATGDHTREGWKPRTDSIISRSAYLIAFCSSCSESDDSSDCDSCSLESASSSSSSFDSMAEYGDEVDDVSTLYYSLGQASALTELWTERAVDSLDNFCSMVGSLIDRIITLPSNLAIENLRLNMFLIYSECDAYLQWTETEHERAVTTESTLFEVLNSTGVDAEINAVNVEDMTAEMIDLFENLTSFHHFYNVEYNAGRFEGYLSVLEARLEMLESDSCSCFVLYSTSQNPVDFICNSNLLRSHHQTLHQKLLEPPAS
jgi:hypothetical protein